MQSWLHKVDVLVNALKLVTGMQGSNFELHWDLPMRTWFGIACKLMEQQQKKYIFQEIKSFSA